MKVLPSSVVCISFKKKVEALGKVKIHLEKKNVNVSVGLNQTFEQIRLN